MIPVGWCRDEMKGDAVDEKVETKQGEGCVVKIPTGWSGVEVKSVVFVWCKTGGQVRRRPDPRQEVL